MKNSAVLNLLTDYRQYDNNGALTLKSTFHTPVGYVHSEVNKSPSLPDWKARVKSGLNAGTSLSGFYRTYLPGQFYVSIRRNTASYYTDWRVTQLWEHWVETTYLVPDYLTNLSEVNANNGALSRLNRSIRSAQTAFQGGVALGEIGQTLKMLRSPAQALRRGFDDYFTSLKKVKRIRKPVERRRALSETWLEYSFGWTPLINDIKEGYEVLKAKSDYNARNRIFGADKTESSTSGFLTTISAGINQFDLFGSRVSSVDVKYYGSCASWVADKFSARSLGLDLSNFLPTAWELIPWSFVVDYFTNVGEVISAVSLQKAGVSWLMKGVKKQYSFAVEHHNYYLNSGAWLKEDARLLRKAKGSVIAVQRSPFNGNLVPNLRFKLPHSGLQWLNLATLAHAHRSLTPFF